MKPHPLIGSMMNWGGGQERRHPLYKIHGPGKLGTCHIIGLAPRGVERTDFLRRRGRMAWGIKQLDSANSLTMVTGRPIVIPMDHGAVGTIWMPFFKCTCFVLPPLWFCTKWQIVYYILRPTHCICFCFTDGWWRLKVDLWVFTLPAHFMLVALWMVEIIVSNHVIHGANVTQT